MVSARELDVVVVPFPFTDKAATKRRPALVVSSTQFNTNHQSAVLAMVTSTSARWQSDVPLRDWRQAGLHVPCCVRFKLFTLDNVLILRRTGALSKRDGTAIQEALGRWLVVDGG